jgi:uncharacterized protein DUF7019
MLATGERPKPGFRPGLTTPGARCTVHCGSRDVDYTRVRTYVYYSNDKIADLEQQLPVPPWWRRALGRIRGAGVGVPGGPSASVNVGPPNPEPILRTMQRVWRYLDSELKLVGTFDDSKEYFYGRLEFYYGIFDSVNPPVFFLVGATNQTIVALGGSKKHVRGHRDQEIRAAENAQNVTMEPDVAKLIHTASAAGSSITMPAAAPGEDIWASYVAGMYSNWSFWEGRKAVYEVLARKEAPLSRVSPPTVEVSKEVLFGSPIFVAQT